MPEGLESPSQGLPFFAPHNCVCRSLSIQLSLDPARWGDNYNFCVMAKWKAGTNLAAARGINRRPYTRSPDALVWCRGAPAFDCLRERCKPLSRGPDAAAKGNCRALSPRSGAEGGLSFFLEGLCEGVRLSHVSVTLVTESVAISVQNQTCSGDAWHFCRTTRSAPSGRK